MTMYTPAAGPAVEGDIARDLAKRALLVAPAVVLALGVVRGPSGALGVALAFAFVVANFLLAAALLTWAARISLTALTAAAMGGFFLRLVLITAAGYGVKQWSAVDFPVFCITLIAAHLGLLFWEMRYVSLTLAAPGLKPQKEKV
ncbi:MAG: ATP synthase subunit I [Acidimicrobiia bacterium]